MYTSSCNVLEFALGLADLVEKWKLIFPLLFGYCSAS